MATYTVSSWSDFCYYTGSTKPEYVKDTYVPFYTSDTVRFGDTYIDGNGNFNGTGNGTRNNPYICGTYNELCKATGAPNVYYLQQVKDGDDENGYHLYYYPKANKYARHDRSNTTIDFNTAQYSGVYTIYIWCVINFNGWTFENLNFYSGSYFRFQSKDSAIYNMMLLKCHAGTSGTNGYALFNSAYTGSAAPDAYRVLIRDSIIQVDLQTTGSTSANNITRFMTAKAYDASMYRCTVSISGQVGYFALGHDPNSSKASYYYDCIFNFDLNTLGLYNYASQYYVYLYGCKITGEIKYRNVDYYTLAEKINNCILDLAATYNGDKYRVTAATTGQLSVSNSDKATFYNASSKNVTELNSTDIKSPTVLRNIGFPIGSDEINGESNV